MYELTVGTDGDKGVAPKKTQTTASVGKGKKNKRKSLLTGGVSYGLPFQRSGELLTSFESSERIELLYQKIFSLCSLQKSVQVDDVLCAVKWYSFSLKRYNSRTIATSYVEQQLRMYEKFLSPFLVVCDNVLGSGNGAVNPLFLESLRTKAVSLCDFAVIYLSIKGLDEMYIRKEVRLLHQMGASNDDASIPVTLYDEKISRVLVNW